MSLQDRLSSNQKLKQKQALNVKKRIDSDILSKVKIPDRLDISFREDYDIRRIDQIIIEKIKLENSDSLIYELMISDTQLKLTLSKSDDDQRYYKLHIKKLMDEMNISCNPSRLEEYQRKAQPYIQEYLSIPKSSTCYDIRNLSSNNYYPTETDYKRISIIKKYINMAMSYIEIHMKCSGEVPSNIDTLCVGCGRDLTDIICDSAYIEYCPFCLYRCDLAYNRIKTIHSINNDEYKLSSSCNELGNFIKAMQYYQGKVPLKPPHTMEDIKLKLDKYFTSNGLPSCDKIRCRPLNSKGQREGTNLEMLIRGMKLNGIDCYTHANLVAHHIWGWTLPNITSLEEVLISDYNATQAVRSTMTLAERGGKSNIPVRLRLCEHLKKRGWNCDYNDFKLPEEYQKYVAGFQIMCQRSGVPELL